MASPQPTPPPIVAPPMPGARVAREVAFDEAGRIAEDLPCLHCGYNLRGLGPEAACPECASAVGRSIQGDLLRFCDPDWLARLAKGLLLIIIGVLAELALVIFIIALFFNAVWGGGLSVRALLVGVAIVGFATSLVVVIGVWWMTAPDPARTERERRVTARTVARWCITAELLSSPLSMMSPSMGFAMTGTMTFPRGILMLLSVIVGIAVMVGYLAGLIYLRRLAMRLPRPGLAQQTRIVMWGYGSLAVASLGFRLVPPPMLMVAAYVIAAAGLVFTVWGLVLLFLYRGALSRAAAEARATWARE